MAGMVCVIVMLLYLLIAQPELPKGALLGHYHAKTLAAAKH